MKTLTLIILTTLVGCSDEQPTTSEAKPAEKVAADTKDETVKKKPDAKIAEPVVDEEEVSVELAYKLTADDCIDPDLTKLMQGVTLMLCDGTIAEGSYEVPETPVMPDLTALAPENVKKSIVIAGVTGTYEVVLPDLSNLSASNIKKDVVIAGVTGTYEAVLPDLTNLSTGNVRDGVTIAGVTGTYNNRPADCANNSQVGCVTTDGYKAADLTNLAAANVRSGVSIAGVAGGYPSATHKLAGADNTVDLTTANFDARMKSATEFEWFDAEGNRYTDTGDADIIAGNIKKDVTVFGLTGTYEGEAISVNAWDVRKGVEIAGVTGELKVACRARNGFAAAGDKCYGEVFENVTSQYAPAGHTCAVYPEKCMYHDKVTSMFLTTGVGNTTWGDASTRCENLSVNGITGWRLPERIELERLYAHGVQYVTDIMPAGTWAYWSSNEGTSAGQHWQVRIKDTGVHTSTTDGSLLGVMCVK